MEEYSLDIDVDELIREQNRKNRECRAEKIKTLLNSDKRTNKKKTVPNTQTANSLVI